MKTKKLNIALLAVMVLAIFSINAYARPTKNKSHNRQNGQRSQVRRNKNNSYVKSNSYKSNTYKSNSRKSGFTANLFINSPSRKITPQRYNRRGRHNRRVISRPKYVIYSYSSYRPKVVIRPQSVTVWLTNDNGSKSPVVLEIAENNYGYIGPSGEYYLTMPTEEQLKMLYGLNPTISQGQMQVIYTQ